MAFGRNTENAAPKNKQAKPSNDEASETSESNRLGVYLFAMALFVVGFGVVSALTYPLIGPAGLIAGAVAGMLLAACIRIAAQWERVVILHFGRFGRIAGPGLYVTVPFIEYIATRIDQRVRIMSFSAEAALTRDLVPVDIDAVSSGWCGTQRRRASKWRITRRPCCGRRRPPCATPSASSI